MNNRWCYTGFELKGSVVRVFTTMVKDSNYLYALRDSVLDRDSHYISKKNYFSTKL